MEFDREEVKSLLHTNKCIVTFEKVNGDLRKMVCTLNPSMIPVVESNDISEKRPKADNPDVLPVYDVEANGWRSFRWNSLKEFSLA